MKSLNIETIDKVISTFSTERDWDQFHSIKNLSMALSVEASELLEIFQWMSEADSNDVANNPETLLKLKDEIADIFIYLHRIAKKAEINIEEAVLNKMKKNAEKYPVEKCRGNSKKYSEI